jgi:hypothetical protein
MERQVIIKVAHKTNTLVCYIKAGRSKWALLYQTKEVRPSGIPEENPKTIEKKKILCMVILRPWHSGWITVTPLKG